MIKDSCGISTKITRACSKHWGFIHRTNAPTSRPIQIWFLNFQKPKIAHKFGFWNFRNQIRYDNLVSEISETKFGPKFDNYFLQIQKDMSKLFFLLNSGTKWPSMNVSKPFFDITPPATAGNLSQSKHRECLHGTCPYKLTCLLWPGYFIGLHALLSTWPGYFIGLQNKN